MTTLTPVAPAGALAKPGGPRLHPADTYLLTLNTSKSRHTMRQALERAARIAARVDRNDPIDYHVAWWDHTANGAEALVTLNARLQQLVQAHRQTGGQRADQSGPFDDGGISASSANGCRCAIRGVLKHAWRARLIDGEHLAHGRDALPVRASKTVAPGRALEVVETSAVFNATPTTALAARDRAMLAVGVLAGLRASEIHGLRAEQLDGPRLKIVGKGGHERVIIITPELRNLVGGWLEHRGTHPGPLWTAVTKSGIVTGRALGETSIAEAVRRMQTAYGLAKFAPHDMRRTAASDVLDATGDLSAAQRFLGHASPTTTVIYDHRADRGVAAAVTAANKARAGKPGA